MVSHISYCHSEICRTRMLLLRRDPRRDPAAARPRHAKACRGGRRSKGSYERRGLSWDAVDLIAGLLTEATARFTPQEALRHPFMEPKEAAD